MTLRTKIELWMTERDWNVRYPAIFTFYMWCIQKGGLGFIRWVQWSRRDRPYGRWGGGE